MAAPVWKSNEILLFIELYRNEPIIWNPRHEFHKNKNKVNDAWIRIADKIYIPINELKKKKESLMTTFRMHQKRKTKSIKSGMGEDELYIPIWPYYDPLEAFLKDIYVCSSVINTEEKIIQDSSSAETDLITQAPEPQTQTAPPTQKRRSKNPPELSEASKEVANAFNTLNRVLDNKILDDDCELYGKLLATKLRKFPQYEREEIMLEIDSMMIKRRRGSENTDSTNMNRSSTSQSSYRSSPSPHYQPNSAQSIPPTYVTIPSQSPHLHLRHSPQYVFNEPQTQRIRILSNDKIYSQSQLMQSSSAQGLQTSSTELPVELHLPELSDRTYNQSQSLNTQNIIYQAYEDA
ncbi:uncharacterized protein LOC123701491 [Colias croceus]|uniref:uncharacterized protein LOC123694046 n=1 Tax=Colias crocea TaxID=72248 RepID=UPI001E27E0B9|nr:uncharacterized protein LOC123694046 [Colias croceus]XP_045504944.1 uncharacterized protein LOC123701491 [Colias croceus]